MTGYWESLGKLQGGPGPQGTPGEIAAVKPSTFYAAGAKAVSPAGDVVTAKVNFTTTATGYAASDWNASVQDGRVAALETTAPDLNSNDGFWIKDRSGRKALGVSSDGSVMHGSTKHRQLSDNHPSAYRMLGLDGRVVFDIRKDGNVFVGPREIHTFIVAGQSNASGRGTPYSATLDPVDQRILQYGAKQQRIVPATVPLDMHDTALGLSPATVFAREYLRNQPAHVTVMLIPAAHGGTGFTTASPLRWDITDAAGLYAQMKTQIAGALTAVADQFGGSPTVKGMIWHQGEADIALTESAYAAYFDAMVADLRTTYGATLPIVLGEMSPDWTLANPSTAGVSAAHIQTPARFENVGFAYADPNTGQPGDTVHFARTGVERLGVSMFRAYKRALMNVAGSPVPPPTVTATRANGVLTIKWEQPPCRATGYTVEYKVDAGAWTAAPAPTPALNTTTTATGITGSTVLVRVATVNASGTSANTQPVTAIGA